MDTMSMDPRLVATLARVRLRAGLVQAVAAAGRDGLPEEQVLAGLRRLVLFAQAPQREVEWAMRSLHADGLIVLVAGRYYLGPSAVAWLKRWVEQRAAAVAPEEQKA